MSTGDVSLTFTIPPGVLPVTLVTSRPDAQSTSPGRAQPGDPPAAHPLPRPFASAAVAAPGVRPTATPTSGGTAKS